MENPQRIKNIVELKNYKKDDLLKNLFNKILNVKIL